MNKERSLGWVVLTAVLVTPVVLYNYSTQRGEKPDFVSDITGGALKPRGKLPEGRTEQDRIKPAVAHLQSIPTPPASAKEPEAQKPVPAEVEAPAREILRDPTMSPYDLVRLMTPTPEPPRDFVPRTPRTPGPRPRIEDGYHIQAIISLQYQAPRAIVNGESVGEGQSIGRAKVLKIGDDSVTFAQRGKMFTRRIGQ